MKTASANLNTHLQGEVTTLATCWYMKRNATYDSGAQVFRFTSHDRDIVLSGVDATLDGTYEAENGFDSTALEGTASLAISNMEIETFFSAAGITEDDMYAGRYNHSEIRIFLVNWADLTQGVIKLFRGHLGEFELHDGVFKVEQRGLKQAYSRRFIETFSPDCRVDLGSTRCGVRLEPPVWQATTAYTLREANDAATGSVVRPTVFNGFHYKCTQAGTSGGSEPTWQTPPTITDDGTAKWLGFQALTIETDVATVTDRKVFTVTNGYNAPDSLLFGGSVLFTSGNNSGLSMEIEKWTLSTKEVQLFLPMPLDIAVSDTVKLRAGCDKTVAVCRDDFDNILNLRGEPYVPGQDSILKTTSSLA